MHWQSSSPVFEQPNYLEKIVMMIYFDFIFDQMIFNFKNRAVNDTDGMDWNISTYLRPTILLFVLYT